MQAGTGHTQTFPAFLFYLSPNAKGRNHIMYDEDNDYSVPLPDETLSESIEGIAKLIEGIYYEAR